MATAVKTNSAVALKGNDNNVVTYQVSGGQEVTLTNTAIRQLTNDNKFITDGEIELFINLCKFQRLNPFTREAYLVKYDGSKPAQMVTALGAFMRMADEQPNYEGIEDGIIVQTVDKKIVDREGCIMYPGETLLGGWAKVHRSDRKFPASIRLDLREYSKGQSTWNSLPKTMINKCAKVAALRKAFPSTYQGLYSEDEIKNTVVPEMEIKEDTDIDTTKIYDINTEEPKETVVEDTIVVEPSEEKKSEENTQTGTQEENDPDIQVISYYTYYNNKEKYQKVNYEDGRDGYQVSEDGKKTIRVRVKK